MDDEWEFADYEDRWIEEMQRSERRLELLRSIEWVHNDFIWFCPWCHQLRDVDGHADECKLAKELS